MNGTAVTLLAFLLDFLATAANQASFAIQKVSHMEQEKRVQTERSDKTIAAQVFCSLKGVCSLFLTAFGGLGHFLALPFCDLTLIARNSSSAVLMNVWIAWKYLGEKFVPKYDITAMSLVSLGTVVIVGVTNKEQQTFTSDELLSLLTSVPSLAYVSTTVLVACIGHAIIPVLLEKLRAFEQDCEDWEARNPDSPKILAAKEIAIDEEDKETDRPERDLINVLYGLPRESVALVSPRSQGVKTWLKVPMLVFAMLPAMVSSLSELFMKVVGCILIGAEEPADYLWLLVFLPLLVLTASRTLVYVNYGIKYYNQMEVMPIYQTNLLIHNILVGMLCLNELKFYTAEMLAAIGLSTGLNCVGIYILLQKNRDKRAQISGASDAQLDTEAAPLSIDGDASDAQSAKAQRRAPGTEWSQSFEAAERRVANDLSALLIQVPDVDASRDDEIHPDTKQGSLHKP